MSSAAIKIENLCKDFGFGLRGVKLRAVDHLNLEIGDNQIYGLLGPNGSGKSTTLKMVLGLLEPTTGSCAIYGVSSRKMQSRQNVGYLPEAPYFYKYLTGRELVRFYAGICGVPKSEREDRVQRALKWVSMEHASDRRVGTYSKGMLQRIGIAQAIVHDPKLVILDEPTAGVDPIGSAAIADMIRALKQEGKTVVLCSHLLAQVEGVCDRVAILDRGKLVAEGEVDALLELRDTDEIRVERLSARAKERLQAVLAEENAKLLSIRPARVALSKLFLEKVNPEAGENRMKD